MNNDELEKIQMDQIAARFRQELKATGLLIFAFDDMESEEYGKLSITSSGKITLSNILNALNSLRNISQKRIDLMVNSDKQLSVFITD